MRQLVFCVLMIFAATARAQEPPAADAENPADPLKPKDAQQVMDFYRQAVLSQVMPAIDEIGPDAIQQQLNDLAVKMIAPHAALLEAEAQRNLNTMPKLERFRLNFYEPAVVEGQQQLDAIAAMLSEQRYGVAPFDQRVLASQWWRPEEAVLTMRRIVMASTLSPQDYGKLHMIERIAPPTVYTVNADPKNPTVAVLHGPQLLLFKLTRIDHGIYAAVEIQWLKRKPANAV